MKACAHARDRIRAGDEDSVREHLERCASCAAFADAHELLSDAEDGAESLLDLDEAFGAVEERLSVRSPLRGWFAEQPTSLRLLAVAAAVAGVILFVGLLSRRVDLGQYPLFRWLLEAGLWVFVTSAVVVRSVRSRHLPPVPSWRTGLLAIAVLSVLAMPLLLPEAHLLHEESLKGIGEDLFHRALACFVWGTSVSLAVGAAEYLVSRGQPGVGDLPVFVWLSTGIFAQTALHLHCPIVHPLHIGLGHTSIVPGLLAGFLLMRSLRRHRV